MVTGILMENMPFIQVVIGGKEFAQSSFFILDTGFTGDLQITPKTASDIGLNLGGETRARIADGSIIEVPYCFATAVLEGVGHEMEILVSQSTPLAGISFLKKFGYTLTLDCNKEKIELEKYS